jgi:hypothetical protein
MTHIEKIPNSDKLKLVKKVEPNFIYNRFDLRCGENFDLYKIYENEKEIYIPVCVDDINKLATIGVWLVQISNKGFKLLKKRIFKDYKNVEEIYAQHSLNKVRKKSKKKIHWHVNLNITMQEFDAKLSKKTRYNTKWYPKKIIEDFGSYHVEHLKADKTPQEIVDKYYEFKFATHHNVYDVKPEEYIKSYYVTDAYILYIGEKIASISFVNITDKNVYMENITYNYEFAKYSPGTVLYYNIVQSLIKEKKYDILFLSSGTSEYKERFNGIPTECYNGKTVRLSSYIKRIPMKFLKLKKK